MLACNWGLTVSGWVTQNFINVLVSGVLAQSAHDVGHLVVGHLAVTNSVKETKSLLEVWPGEGEKFGLLKTDTSWSKETSKQKKNIIQIHFESQSCHVLGYLWACGYIRCFG